MKKLACIVLSLILAGSMATVVQAEEAESASGGENYLMGLSLFSRDFTVDICEQILNDEAAAYEEETGNHVDFTWLFCEYSVDQQIADVESLITKGCDAIAVRVTDTEGCNVCFDMCREAEIPSVAMWNGGEGADITIFAVDNYIIGQHQANWFIDYQKQTGETYICGYLDGISTADDTLLRCKGFCDAIEAEYGDLTSGPIQVVEIQYSENNADTSQKLTEDWLVTHPDMNCVIGWNDISAYGATQAFISNGFAPDEYVIIGCDGTDYNDLLHDSTWEMTVGITFAPNCEQLWNTMIALCEGDMDRAHEYGDVTPDSYFDITKDNIEEWNELAGL